MSANPELTWQENVDQLEKSRGREEKSDRAQDQLSQKLDQKKVDELPEKWKKDVTRIITELNNLRNNPVELERRLKDPLVLATLKKNGIPLDYIQNLLNDMRSIHREELLAQVNDGNMGPVKSDLSQKVEWVKGGLHELFRNLTERQEKAGPLAEDANVLAELRSEVEEAENEVDNLLLRINNTTSYA